MAEVALIFGSDDGNTEQIAYRIQRRLGEALVDVMDVADLTRLDFLNYQRFILAIPTWDFGQIQSDWDEFWNEIGEVDFSSATVAFVGLGDQFGYGDYFLDAMGMLHDLVVARGAKVVGHWPTAGYEFDASKALHDNGTHFVGLAIDQDQQEDLTAERLNRWCRQIVTEFGLDAEPVDLDDE